MEKIESLRLMPSDAKARKERPLFRGLLDYFPAALAEVAHVSFKGNEQHNPGQPMHWAREKSKDHEDCIVRHLLEAGTRDSDGLLHTAKLAWRALALLQLELEAEEGEKVCAQAGPLPDAPGRVMPEPYRKRRVYVAGPMRGIEKFNFPAFDAARDLLREQGWDVVSPADIDRDSGFHEDNPPTAAYGAAVNRTFAKRDTEALLSFRAEKGDAIALLPGWEKSTGARAEFFLAAWLGLRVIDARNGRPWSKPHGASPESWGDLSELAVAALRTLSGKTDAELEG